MPSNHRKNASVRKSPATVVMSVVLIGVAGFWAGARDPEPQPRTAAFVAPPATTTRTTTTTVSTQPVQAAPVMEPLPEISFMRTAPCSTSLSGTRPHVAMVGNLLKAMFAVKDVGGRSSRAGSKDDHTVGLALDFMVSNAALGTSIANYVLANQQRLGVTYVIWQQRINSGGGWSMMENRGSRTANHYDHVHVSFLPSANVSLFC
jgi:uncharacterized protein YbdZ (MbtH family)